MFLFVLWLTFKNLQYTILIVYDVHVSLGSTKRN